MERRLFPRSGVRQSLLLRVRKSMVCFHRPRQKLCREENDMEKMIEMMLKLAEEKQYRRLKELLAEMN